MSTKHNIDLNVPTNLVEEGSTEIPRETNLPIIHFQGALSFHPNRDNFVNEEAYRNSKPVNFNLNKLPYSSAEEETSEEEREVKKRKVLTNEERQTVYEALLQRSVNGKLKKTSTREVASTFSVSMRTVQRIWKRSFKNLDNGVPNVSHCRTKNCDRKRIEIDMEQFWNIPQQHRTLRTAAKAMNVSISVLFRHLKSSATVKPFFSRDNRIDYSNFSCSSETC